MKKRISSFALVAVLLLALVLVPMFVMTAAAEDPTAALSFANTTNRTSFSAQQQVWEENGITFTNNKASSSSNVADHSNPVRLYASSEIVIECSLGNITKIEFTANSGSYATALQSSIGEDATATVSDKVVTVTPTTPAKSYTISKLTAQVRLNSLTVTYSTAGVCQHTNTETITTPATNTEAGTIETKCTVCDEIISTETLPPIGFVASFDTPEGIDAPENIQSLNVTMPSLPDLTEGYVYSYSFAGWAKAELDGEVSEAPELYPAGEVVTLSEDTTFYAVYRRGNFVAGGYIATAIADIKATDKVVLVWTKSTGTYAPTNNNGTGSAPAATAVTVDGNSLSGDIAKNLLWNISYDNGNITIYPDGTTETWLYCTNANNGVRVGTNANKVFTIDGNYLKHTGTNPNRYLGIYSEQDLRCYDSPSATNIANQTVTFYVYHEGQDDSFYTTEPAKPLEGCTHTDTKIDEVPATCEKAGYRNVICANPECGHVLEETVLDQLEHDYQVTDSKDATCTEAGYVEKTCQNGCEDVQTETIPAKEHDWGEGVATTAPGCDTTGVKTYTCSECGEIKTEVIPAKGHEWDEGVETTAPDCDTTGVKTYTCSECGETKTEDIPAKGHKWGEGVETTAPGCDTTGVKTYTCSECGETKTEDIPELGHLRDAGVQTKAPEQGKPGEMTYTCQRDHCGATFVEEIPALPWTPTFVVPEGFTAPTHEDAFNVTMPNVGFDIPTGKYFYSYIFAGWATEFVSETKDMPELYSAGDVVTLTENTTFYAVYVRVEVEQTSITYEKTAIDDIKATDKVVLVWTKSTGTYAPTNNNGTGDPPAATAVTVDGNSLSGVIAETLLWNISYDNGNITIYPDGTTETWLYCTNTNNGVRVGTNANKVFTIDGDYLKNTGTTRYLGIYSEQDLRCYTSSTATNIKDQTVDFYVLKESKETSYYTSKLVEAPSISGTRVELDKNLSLHYYLNVDESFDASKLTAKFLLANGVEVDAEAIKEQGGNRYYFVCTDIGAHQMGDKINATFYYDGAVLFSDNTWSIKVNLDALYSKEDSSAALKALIANVLNYGAAAQVYANYDVENLVNVGYENSGSSENATSEDSVKDYSQPKYGPTAEKYAYVTAFNMEFDYANRIIFKVATNNTNSLVVRINGETVELVPGGTEGIYLAYSEALDATEFAKAYEIELEIDGVIVQTAQYSANSYAYVMWDDVVMDELVQAMYRYGKSLDAYLAELN